jgi:hypothetical protein
MPSKVRPGACAGNRDATAHQGQVVGSQGPVALAAQQ